MFLNPNQYINQLIGKKIKVRLKWGIDYNGTLETVDSYMNLKLNNSEEWFDNTLIGNLGEIIIRCNNIAYFGELNEK